MNKNKGFTLIELIVSIIIFSVAMTGIVMFTASNSRWTNVTNLEKNKSIIKIWGNFQVIPYFLSFFLASLSYLIELILFSKELQSRNKFIINIIFHFLINRR